jgi:hypothetical protein
MRSCAAVAAHRCRRTTLPPPEDDHRRAGGAGWPRRPRTPPRFDGGGAHTAHARPARFHARFPIAWIEASCRLGSWRAFSPAVLNRKAGPTVGRPAESHARLDRPGHCGRRRPGRLPIVGVALTRDTAAAVLVELRRPA